MEVHFNVFFAFFFTGKCGEIFCCWKPHMNVWTTLSMLFCKEVNLFPIRIHFALTLWIYQIFFEFQKQIWQTNGYCQTASFYLAIIDSQSRSSCKRIPFFFLIVALFLFFSFLCFYGFFWIRSLLDPLFCSMFYFSIYIGVHFPQPLCFFFISSNKCLFYFFGNDHFNVIKTLWATWKRTEMGGGGDGVKMRRRDGGCYVREIFISPTH